MGGSSLLRPPGYATAVEESKSKNERVFYPIWKEWEPMGCRIELNNTSQNLSALALLPGNAYFLPVDANFLSRPIPRLLLLIQSLDFTFYKILSVLNIMMTVDSLFLTQGRSPFHLSALETTFMRTPNPALCRQKELVYNLKIKCQDKFVILVLIATLKKVLNNNILSFIVVKKSFLFEKSQTNDLD